MRQSVIRLLVAALVAVLSASLLSGIAFAEGPVPEQPPGEPRRETDLSFMEIPSMAGQPIQPVDGVLPERQVFIEVILEPIPIPDGMLALTNSNGGCYKQTVTRYERYGPTTVWELKSWTKFCYDGTNITSIDEMDEDWHTGVAPPWYPGSYVNNLGSDMKTVSGGVGQSSHYDHAWGKYAICKFPDPNIDPPYEPQCNAPIKVTIDKVQRGNGTVDPH